MKFADYIEYNTKEYLAEMTKAERKKIGQFFTPAPIAEHMGSLMTYNRNEITVLDTGAGSGILSAALIDKICLDNCVKTINLDLYENNVNVLTLLKTNMEHIKRELWANDIKLNYRLFDKNFILENQFIWSGLFQNQNKYDVVISNPPYKKIGKNDPESMAMKDIVFGQPNLYFLFMAMSAKLLKEHGEFIFIVPRSFSSGLYFTEFRKWFLGEMKITNLHLFVSRDTVFNCDNILQETIIIKAEKTDITPTNITITESKSAGNYKNLDSFTVSYNTCIKNDSNAFLFFPTTKEDVKILDFINQWECTLSDAGYQMKTGTVVDFRETQWLRNENAKDTIPLLWAYNFDKNQVEFPVQNNSKPQYLLMSEDTARLQMKIANYILIKRFTSKEERKRLQCALLFRDDFSAYDSISTENHLNFITKINGDMTKEEMYGLFVVINSNYMDKYFRILNGSTQVNANEINSIPFPKFSHIIELGLEALKYSSLDENTCDAILEQKYTIQPKYRVV